MKLEKLLDFSSADGFEDQNQGRGAHQFFLIGELGLFVGMDPKTIRFYEREGLLAPMRQGKFRVYTAVDAKRLQVIKMLRNFGLPIAVIREIIVGCEKSLNWPNEFATNLLRKQLKVLALEKENLARSIEDLSLLLAS